MVHMKDYEKNGKLDWEAYKQAQINSGEICYNCRSFILFGKGLKRLCHQCQSINEDTEYVTHSKLIRCPKCKHQMDVHDCELYELYEDGDHDISCNDCNHTFTIKTNASYSFESPELI